MKWMYRRWIKRPLDLMVAMIVLLCIWPILVAIALCIVIESCGRGSVLFKQRRIGKDKEEFYIYKFRTMKSDTPKDIPTHLLKNPDAFITRVGKFLRRTSLDELPQIFNILKGEMSFVGPRPALWNQYDLIALRDKNGANRVMPGLTGLAQVKGRDELPIGIKAAYDGRYVRRMGLAFDCFIVVLTVKGVFTAHGIREGEK